MSVNNISVFAHKNEIEKYYLQETPCRYHPPVVIEIPTFHFTVRKELINLSRVKREWGG